MAILADLQATGEGRELWIEFTQAAPGHNQVARSHHLDEIQPPSLSSLITKGSYCTTRPDVDHAAEDLPDGSTSLRGCLHKAPPVLGKNIARTCVEQDVSPIDSVPLRLHRPERPSERIMSTPGRGNPSRTRFSA
jgi:hypothetical protein